MLKQTNFRIGDSGSVSHCRRIARGGAIIETIIVLPLLLSMTFGAVEYSFFLYTKNALAAAARDGVRAAIPSTGTNANVTTAVASSLSAVSIPASSYTITTIPSTVSTATAGSAITVTVTATWGTVGITPLPVWLGGIPSSKQVVGTAVMMREQ